MGSFAAGAGTRTLVYSGSGGATTLGPLTLTGGTQTTSVPVIDATQTWNAGGVTFTGIKFNVTDTASAAGSLLLDLQVGGISAFSVFKTGAVNISYSAPAIDRAQIMLRPSSGVPIGFNIDGTGSAVTFRSLNDNKSSLAFRTNAVDFASDGRLRWTNAAQDPLTTLDLVLVRDATGTLAQRNGVNAQTFNIYNTFTDASNYERGFLSWNANVFQIGAFSAGTGTQRKVDLVSSNGAADAIRFYAGTYRWQIDGTNGHFLAATDNSFDIGATSTGRPRNLFVASAGTFGTDISVGGYVWPSAAGGLRLGSFGWLRANSDGVFMFFNNAGSDFGRLQFGGSSVSFPALKRNGTTLETKLADDSNYAPHAMQYLDITDGVTAPGAATGRARIYVDTADGDLKIIFADGTIKTIVVDT